MRREIKAGSTSVSIPIFLADTSSTTGGGLGSLVYNSAGLVAEYRRKGQSAWTSISLVSKTLGTYVSGGFVADGSVAGFYEFDAPNAALASGADWVVFRFSGAANMLATPIEITLVAIDKQDAAAAGLSRIDAAMSSRSSHSAADVWLVGSRTITGGTVSTVGDKTGYSLATAPPTAADNAAAVWGAGSRTITGGTVSTVGDKTGYSLATAPPTLAAIVSGVWDASLASHLTAGSTGAALNASSSAGDPWATTLPGAYGAGTAGYIIGSRIDAAMSSRSSHSAADVWLVGSRTITGGTVSTVGDKTGYSLAVAPPTAADNAAAVWSAVTRTITGGTVSTVGDKTGYSLATAPPTAAAIAAAVDSTLSTSHGSGAWTTADVSALATTVSAVKTTTDRLSTAMEADGLVYRFTTNALEMAPAGGGGGGTVDADAVALGVYRRLVGASVALLAAPVEDAALDVVNSLDFDETLDVATAADSVLVFTVRRCVDDAGAALEVTSQSGLVTVNGAAPDSPLKGTVTRDSATAASVWIAAEIMSELSPGQYSAEIREIKADGKVGGVSERVLHVRRSAGRRLAA